MFDFVSGETILVDKPLQWTSFDVVNKLRSTIKRKLNIKKIKVGHAGTLDPLASGLLIVCTGKRTKTIEELMAQTKEYTGSILLDQSRSSLDFETEIDKLFDVSELSCERIETLAESFVGEQMQKAPMFSAKRVDGKKLYDYAREGKELTVKEHLVNIHEFEITSCNLPQIDFRLKCSKGTYVRSLARDFGAQLGVGGVLSSLRRTAIGDYNIQDSKALNSLLKAIEDAEFE